MYKVVPGSDVSDASTARNSRFEYVLVVFVSGCNANTTNQQISSIATKAVRSCI